MAATKIEWCNKTINVVTGCTPISDGCKNCYAAAIAVRFWGNRKFSDIKFHPGRLRLFFTKRAKKIFINSMGDFYHFEVTAQMRDCVYKAILKNSQHTFIILTKRPENIGYTSIDYEWYVNHNWPDNLWIGVTAENQTQFNKRVRILLKIPASTRFVSVEPMLEKINIGYHDHLINWVICGAETGPGARHMDINWAIDLKNQCRKAGIPYFFKKVSKGDTIPPGLQIREFPK